MLPQSMSEAKYESAISQSCPSLDTRVCIGLFIQWLESLESMCIRFYYLQIEDYSHRSHASNFNNSKFLSSDLQLQSQFEDMHSMIFIKNQVLVVIIVKQRQKQQLHLQKMIDFSKLYDTIPEQKYGHRLSQHKV